MIAVVSRPIEFIVAIPIVHSVLCLIPCRVDKCKRLAHR